MASKYGFIDKNGKVVIEPQFNYINDFSKGIAETVFVSHMFIYLNNEEN